MAKASSIGYGDVFQAKIIGLGDDTIERAINLVKQTKDEQLLRDMVRIFAVSYFGYPKPKTKDKDSMESVLDWMKNMTDEEAKVVYAAAEDAAENKSLEEIQSILCNFIHGDCFVEIVEMLIDALDMNKVYVLIADEKGKGVRHVIHYQSPGDRSDEALKKLAEHMYEGRVFCDKHIRKGDENLLPIIFMPLTLGGAKFRWKLQRVKIGLIYQYISEAGPRGVNGYPTFFSMRYLSQDETNRFLKIYKQFCDFMKQWDAKRV
jgi:hypothetical protein